jgi:DNA polymerase III alpha subunit (gram-positive type)
MLPKLVDFIYAGWEQGIPLVGHNIGSYDLNLLNAELVRNGFGQLKISGPILDTCDMFRMCGHKKAKLEIATAYYGIVNRGAHDAKWDVVASIELLFAMMKESTLMRETSLRDAYTQQKVGHRMWAQDMRAFFTARGKQFDSSDDWPVFKRWEQK